MKKMLRDHPKVWKAFQIILDDQPYMGKRVTIPGTTLVPKHLHSRFATTEKVLCELIGKSLEEVGVTKADLRKEHCSKDLEITDNAFNTVVLPVNDVQRSVYKRAGISKADAKVTDTLLYEFFDGDLRDMFQKGHR